jgi:hypothetical protein
MNSSHCDADWWSLLIRLRNDHLADRRRIAPTPFYSYLHLSTANRAAIGHI